MWQVIRHVQANPPRSGGLLSGILALIAFVASGIGSRALAADPPKVDGIAIDTDKKTVTIDAKVAPRKLEHLKGETYPIEVIACWAHDHQPKGQKAHETVVTINVKPSDVHKALESLGLQAGKPVKGGESAATGPDVNVYLDLPTPEGTAKRISIDRALIDPKTKKPFPRSVKFRFTGSAMSQPDPNKPDKVYGADMTGTLIAVYPVTDETVCQSSLTMKEEKYLKLETNKDVLPKEGTPVKLVLEVAK
jgi:hypothetical protein